MKKIRRILAVILCAAMMMAFIPAAGAAAESYGGTCGENLTWEFDADTGVLTISGTGDMSDMYTFRNGVYVSCPWEKSGVTSVIIEEGVTSIGNGAFSDCDTLVSVTIPASITSIGAFAFESCGALLNIMMSDGVTSIGIGAFSGCGALENITIPESVTNIGEYAFSNCSALSSVELSRNVTNIPRLAFYNCGALESVIIPEGVTSIEESAFEDCGALSSVEIPKSVTSIGERAFYGCSALESIVIPESVEMIGRAAFADCGSFENVMVPENAPKQIGIFAFGVDFDGSDDDVAVVVDNNLLMPENAPYIKDGRTLVPMRAIFEALGCSVEWDDEEKSVTATAELGYEIKLIMGETTMHVDGRAVELDTAAEVTNDCTFVPVRAIGEALECDVEWDGDNKIVEITLWWTI